MNKISKKVIGALLLTSVLSISFKDEENTELYDYGLDDSPSDNISKKSKGAIVKNLLQFKGDSQYRLIARHRSHYSHRSHRSGGSRCSKIIIPSEAILGDRLLTKGVFGADVEMLVSLLKSKQIIDDNRIEKKNGYCVYNDYLTSAIKNFQLKENLLSTGICDKNTVKRLL